MSRLELAEDVDLRLEAVSELVTCLEAEGLVHHVSRRGSEVGVTLALAGRAHSRSARLVELASRATLGARPRTGAGWDALAARPRERPDRRRREDARRRGRYTGFGLRRAVWPSADASTR